jgi:chromosomal replication initiation ATPase DnaA
MSEKNKMLSPYVFPGIKIDFIKREDYPYLFKPKELQLTKEAILEIISFESGISIEMITSKCREKSLVDARNLYCKILKDALKMKLTKIAKELGKDHTTIIWNIRKFDDRYELEDDYREFSDRVFKKVGLKIS